MSVDQTSKPLSAASLALAQAQNPANKAKQAKLRQACRMYESHFLQVMFKEMRRTVPKGGLMHGGFAEDMFTDMLDQARADQSTQGRSLGLADMMEKQLGRERLRKIPDGLRQGQFRPLPGLAPAAPGPEAQAEAQAAAAQAAATEAGLTPAWAEQAPAGDSVTMPMPPLVDMEAGGSPLGADAPIPLAAPGSSTPSLIPPQYLQESDIRPGRTAPAIPAPLGIGQDLLPPVQGEVTSTFGLRIHPVHGDLRHHRGLDLAAPEGAPIRAARAGVVRFAGEAGEYGRLVVVEHDDGTSALYGHCRGLRVKVGQQVARGQNLGTVGMTGLASGPHLHFELRSPSGEAMDPLPLVAKGLGQSA